jgi:hypothetical protein
MKWIFPFALITLLIFACKKEDETPVSQSKTVMPVTQSIKDWGYFKKGSYWIFKDSLTSAIDSVYVTAVSIGTQTTTSNLVDYITISFNDPNYDYTLCSWPFDRMERRGNWNSIVFNPTMTSTTTTYGAGINSNYDVDSLIVAGVYMHSLRQLYYSYNQTVWEVERAYWKKHVGRVKKCPFPGTASLYHAYELIRYNVTQ